MGYVGNQTTTAFTSMDKQDITGNGGANYTLSHAVANANEIEVFVNNVRQEPTVAYSASGTTLTMTGNVASTDDFYVVYQGKAVGTIVPPDGSVSTTKIADDAVTSAKIADNAVVTASIADDAVTNAKIDTVAASKLTGALPAIDGSALTGVGGTTPAFCVTRNSDQTSNSGVSTLVQWNAEIYDSDGKFASNRFTPTEAGYYYLFAQVNNNNLYNQAALSVFIRKNGADIMTGVVAGNNSTSNRDYTINCSIINVADSNDYFEVYAQQQLGNGQMIASADRCVFLGFKVG